jgi:fructose-1,6-bisphosphatase/inositol monophosphatase family enzyme
MTRDDAIAAPGRSGRDGTPMALAGQRDVPGGTVSRVARYDDDLRFAHVLADAADDITTRRFRALDLRVETKPDLTPVSDADQAAEESLRNVLRRARPRDAVLGEELGRSGYGPRCWVLDPIDGTKNYVRGVPVWATLIGLMDGPEVVVGVVSAPALGRRWWGALGGGAWTGRSLTKASRCRVSGVTKLGDASLSYSGLGGWAERGTLDNFLGLPGRCGGRARSGTSGRTCWSPRAPATSPPNPRYRCGIWPLCRSSSPRPAGGSPHSRARPGRTAAAR